jgi:hypothetical protein
MGLGWQSSFVNLSEMFDELLRFAEVGHVALRVGAPRKKPKKMKEKNLNKKFLD